MGLGIMTTGAIGVIRSPALKTLIGVALVGAVFAGCSSNVTDADANKDASPPTTSTSASASSVPQPQSLLVQRLHLEGADLGLQDEDIVKSADQLCTAFRAAPNAPYAEVERVKKATARLANVSARVASIYVDEVFANVCPEARPKPPPKPVLKVTFDSSCNDDWPVVFQTQPYRFVAETHVHNRGNVPAEVMVTTDWLFFGGGKTSLSKKVRLKPGATLRVPFSKPASLDEVSRMVGWQHGDRMCRTAADASPTN